MNHHVPKTFMQKVGPALQIAAIGCFGYATTIVWWEHHLKVKYYKWWEAETKYWKVVHDIDSSIHNPVSVFPEIFANSDTEEVYHLSKQVAAYYGLLDNTKDPIDDITPEQLMNQNKHHEIKNRIIELLEDEETKKELLGNSDNNPSSSESTNNKSFPKLTQTDFETLAKEELDKRNLLIAETNSPPTFLIDKQTGEYQFTSWSFIRAGAICACLPRGWKFAPIVLIAAGSYFIKL